MPDFENKPKGEAYGADQEAIKASRDLASRREFPEFVNDYRLKAETFALLMRVYAGISRIPIDDLPLDDPAANAQIFARMAVYKTTDGRGYVFEVPAEDENDLPAFVPVSAQEVESSRAQ